MTPLPSPRLARVCALALGLLAGGMLAREDGRAGEVGCPGCVTSLEELKGLGMEELDQLFCHADGTRFPVGFARGCILVTAAKHPKLRTCVAGATWEGKCFEADGYFVNQWRGFRAIHSHAACGTSWCDGGPCVVLEYPPRTPLFANIHEEVREVGPGVFLVRAYECRPCPKFLEYIGLEL